MFIKSNKGQVSINGVVYTGNNITIVNGKVIEDGEIKSEISEPVIDVSILGDVGSIEASAGQIDVTGNVNNISTQSGDVYCENVNGSISTMSGDVNAEHVAGNVNTMSGDINYNKGSF